MHCQIANVTPQVRQNDKTLFSVPAPATTSAFALSQADAAETLRFLSARPVQTVVMSSFIEDNGIVSELNRGLFYGHRNSAGELDGVALIGHSTLVEARSDEAMRAFASVAKDPKTPIHLIMASGRDAERFHRYLTVSSASPRLTCVETYFEASYPFAVQKCEYEIQPADISQLDQIAEAQAEIAFLECGVDPLIRDREGFIKRVKRRIEQGRVFSVYEDGRLIFKADIIAETEHTVYLEGIYIDREYRGVGLGSRCLAKLTEMLMERAENICLLSNVNFTAAHRSYEKAGLRASEQSVTLFV